MDDPSWAWPAWKFDMKREDLFTKLHDQYNTYLSPMQDSEAFYHDITEISFEAQSIDEFHHLASDRRQRRLGELNKSLESAKHAVQLFRTHSLDSLVRYFASYLPDDHIWHPLGHETTDLEADSISTSRFPEHECKRVQTKQATGLETQALLSPSKLLKPSLLVNDESSESNEPSRFVHSTSEPVVKLTHAQDCSCHSSSGEDVVSSGDDILITSNPDLFTTVACRETGISKDTMHTCKRLSTKLALKQLKSWKGCSVDQRARTKPEASTSIPMNSTFQGPSQALNTSDGTVQVVAGGTTGLKRKRT
ncbi:uncharacterized protein B0J16DRAFT_349636 [Fusarium flagelliforme]|uniref:uncharacterized protein n=1 Tax=Fusarium flagelliforme TaxID=2675880 RepID=UPI001E8DD939|nr:uncharacterized protein B0J16DRAFT_349636 [Fusarium flagelliforme]KAH7175166.1 hypothetical protein B0J16DRAFT_349636 [Fusarium flagelliforme]